MLFFGDYFSNMQCIEDFKKIKEEFYELINGISSMKHRQILQRCKHQLEAALEAVGLQN